MICMECTSKLILFRKFRRKCVEINAALDAFRTSAIPSAREVCPNDISEESEAIGECPAEAEMAPKALDNISQENDYGKVECLEIDPIDIMDMDNASMDEESEPEYLFEEEHLGTEVDLKSELPNSPEKEHHDDECDAIYLEDDQDSIHNNPTTLTESILSTKHTHPVCYCDLCGATFSRKFSLAQHMLSHFGIKKFTCDICGQKFTRKPHLIYHLRIHLDHRPYVCPDCPKTFIKLSDMERHRAVHSDRRPFACTVCEKRFKRSTDVTTHMITHSGRKPYNCNMCEKGYGSHSSLKKHMLRFHGVEVVGQRWVSVADD